MGLFDAIERLNTTGEQPPTPRAPLLPRPSAGTVARNLHQPTAKEDVLDTWEASLQELEERQSVLNLKPERLSFLAPCPVCHGRAFLHIAGGGFFCRTCIPGFFGQPVEATGSGRLVQAIDAELLQAREDRNVTVIQKLAGNQPTETQRAYFVTAAWPWIKGNLAALSAARWSMAGLVQRSKYRWPVGC